MKNTKNTEQLSLFPELEIKNAPPIMPDEYKGNVTKSCGYTKSAPRDWTEEEINWILQLKKEGWSMDDIAQSVGRTTISISVKLKRIGKKEYNYNADHVEQKYETNTQYLSYILPNSVLDLYAGIHSWWQSNTDGIEIVTNDQNPQSDAYYHEKAEKLIHKLYYEGYKFDVIDLDPFGSAYDCFDLAVKMAKRGIIITYGEMGHKRFKRLDYVSRYYGIESMEDFTIDRLIEETKKIALRSKKVLTPVFVCNWNRISRVYYEITPLKITEQWI